MNWGIKHKLKLVFLISTLFTFSACNSQLTIRSVNNLSAAPTVEITGPTGSQPTNLVGQSVYTLTFSGPNPVTLIGAEATVNSAITIGGTNTSGCFPTTSGCTATVCTVTVSGCTSTRGIINISVGAGAYANSQGTPVIPAGPSDSFTVYNPTRFAYVANMDSGTIGMYSINTTSGLLAKLPTYSIASGAVTDSIEVDPSGRFAYGANYSANTVTMYKVSASTGALTPLVPSTVTVSGAKAVKIDPTGRFVYVGNLSLGKVTILLINQITGLLTTVGNINSGLGTYGLAIDPNGKFLYSINYSANTISQFTINQSTGALTAMSPATVATTEGTSITIDSSGRFLYATNSTTATVSMYSINQSTGLLTALSPATVVTGVKPWSIVFDPFNRYAYVANHGAATISKYSFNKVTGQLTSLGTVATGTNPSHITVEQSGRFAYVTTCGVTDCGSGGVISGFVSNYSINQDTGDLTLIGSIATSIRPNHISTTAGPSRYVYSSNNQTDNVSMFSVDQATGTLSSIGSPVSTGQNPHGITVEPTGRFTYVANGDYAINGSISKFALDSATGLLSPIGTKTLTGVSLSSIVVEATGRYVYALSMDDDSILKYNIDQVTGELSSLVVKHTGVVEAATGNVVIPTKLITDSTGRFLMVINYDYSTNSGGILTYLINSTDGTLTYSGNIGLSTFIISMSIDPTGRYAYVGRDDAKISKFALNPNTGLLSTQVDLAKGNVNDASVDPTGRFLYATDGASVLAGYNIYTPTGTITPIPTVATTGSGIASIVVEPSGRFAFSCNAADESISSFLVNSTDGTLSGRTDASTGVGSSPRYMAATR